MNGTKSSRVGLGRFRPISLVLVLLATLVLAACGDDDEDEPTPAPTAPPLATAPAPDAATPIASAAAGGASGTPAAVPDTVGRLAEGIAAAWPQTSYRRVQTSTASPSATPTAGLASETTTDEVLYPGRVHRTVVDANGATTAEFILVDDRLYARGEQIPDLFAPGTGPQTWIELTGPLMAPGGAGANILSQLQALFPPRYSGLSPEQQARDVTLASEISVDGRACFVFQTAETTQTGERLEVGIAIEPDGRLCSVTTTAGGLDIVEVFTFDVPVVIEPPTQVATPAVGVPIASPAAPASASPVATPTA